MSPHILSGKIIRSRTWTGENALLGSRQPLFRVVSRISTGKRVWLFTGQSEQITTGRIARWKSFLNVKLLRLEEY
jgi:hypothetical protein